MAFGDWYVASLSVGFPAVQMVIDMSRCCLCGGLSWQSSNGAVHFHGVC